MRVVGLHKRVSRVERPGFSRGVSGWEVAHVCWKWCVGDAVSRPGPKARRRWPRHVCDGAGGDDDAFHGRGVECCSEEVVCTEDCGL